MGWGRDRRQRKQDDPCPLELEGCTCAGGKLGTTGAGRKQAGAAFLSRGCREGASWVAQASSSFCPVTGKMLNPCRVPGSLLSMVRVAPHLFLQPFQVLLFMPIAQMKKLRPPGQAHQLTRGRAGPGTRISSVPIFFPGRSSPACMGHSVLRC